MWIFDISHEIYHVSRYCSKSKALNRLGPVEARHLVNNGTLTNVNSFKICAAFINVCGGPSTFLLVNLPRGMSTNIQPTPPCQPRKSTSMSTYISTHAHGLRRHYLYPEVGEENENISMSSQGLSRKAELMDHS